jgi:ABC-type antimicrobial peptide transport system permease subunit
MPFILFLLILSLWDLAVGIYFGFGNVWILSFSLIITICFATDHLQMLYLIIYASYLRALSPMRDSSRDPVICTHPGIAQIHLSHSLQVLLYLQASL